MVKQKFKHVILGLSGGVDSSVAAHLLLQAGYSVEAVIMKNWEENAKDLTACSYAKDLRDATNVCDKLNIELTCVNFADEYWQHVFMHFLHEYRCGRTPNPDILCNKEIKFKAFLNFAKTRGADFIATGHYVRKQIHDHAHARGTSTKTLLLKARDQNKDQSYFLHALNESQIAASLFPLGELTKIEVRAIAKHLGFSNYQKKDSTGICFIGERRFKEFLHSYLPASPGLIQTLTGENIGEHDGLMFYTIGQRQGLKIGGRRGQKELPWYVVDKDVSRNILLVVQGDHPKLYNKSLMVSALHWINKNTSLPTDLHAKIRYRQQDQACCITPTTKDGLYKVSFAQPQRGIAPGQSIVFYQGDICLGGGIINAKRPDECGDPDYSQSVPAHAGIQIT